MLQSYPFIRFSRDAVVGTLIEKWLQDSGITVRDTMELGGLEAIYGMVLANLGVSIVPEPCMKLASQPPLRRIPLNQMGAPVRELGHQDTRRRRGHRGNRTGAENRHFLARNNRAGDLR